MEHSFSDELTIGADTHWYECACGDKKDEAAHAYDETVWAHDAAGHWHVCACGATTEAAEHNWDNGKVTTDPSTEKDGEKTFTCVDCGETKTERIPQLETPKSGDDFDVALCVAFMLLACLCLAATVLIRKLRVR